MTGSEMLRLFGEGEAAPAETAQEPAQENAEAQRQADFEQLIGSTYRDLYDTRVAELTRQAERLEALEPLLAELAGRYGVEEPEALLAAVQAEAASREPVQEAAETAVFRRWEQQAAEARQLYPGLDMTEELRDDRFRRLIMNDVDVRTAFEVVHSDRLLPAAMSFAARTAERKLANALAANSLRPAEGGSRGASTAALKPSVASLSRRDMAEIERRVRNGEKISFV